MRRLFGFGQMIESAFEIPGALAATGPDAAEPGLSILRGESEAGETAGPAGFTRDDEGLRLAVPGLATFLCRERRIVVGPRRGAEAQDIGDLLIASAMPAALWMQGRLVLHAAAVCLRAGGPAVGLLGRSGAGKSTLAASLVARGARLLADDSIAVAASPGGLVASGLPGGLFLSADREGARSFLPLVANQSVAAARLGALVLLDEAADEPSLARLPDVRAVEAVLAHRHRPRASDLLGLRAQTLRDCVRVARTIPVFAWRRTNAMLDGDVQATEVLARALF